MKLYVTPYITQNMIRKIKDPKHLVQSLLPPITLPESNAFYVHPY